MENPNEFEMPQRVLDMREALESAALGAFADWIIERMRDFKTRMPKRSFEIGYSMGSTLLLIDGRIFDGLDWRTPEDRGVCAEFAAVVRAYDDFIEEWGIVPDDVKPDDV